MWGVWCAFFLQLLQNITQTTSSFFANNKDMKYYYDEIFNGIESSNETVRNINLEQIYTTNILINIDKILNNFNATRPRINPNYIPNARGLMKGDSYLPVINYNNWG